jgi:RimJ/RimL family protein N-acetyltransferase
MIFQLRFLAYEDIEWLRDLRNVCRSEFFDKREVNPEQQEAWFRSAAYGDERWVIAAGDQRIGYFSIVSPKPDLPIFPTDGRPVRYFSTMMVAPEHRGQGAILAAAPVFDLVSHCYSGYVGEGNHASLRACTKLGFTDRGKYKHPVYGLMHLVWRDK